MGGSWPRPGHFSPSSGVPGPTYRLLGWSWGWHPASPGPTGGVSAPVSSAALGVTRATLSGGVVARCWDCFADCPKTPGRRWVSGFWVGRCQGGRSRGCPAGSGGPVSAVLRVGGGGDYRGGGGRVLRDSPLASARQKPRRGPVGVPGRVVRWDVAGPRSYPLAGRCPGPGVVVGGVVR